MPYVITTTTPENTDTVTPGQPWPRSVSRRAVATLREARAYMRGRVLDTYADGSTIELTARVEQAETLPESGGTVGPLPDGTVIEVAPKTWAELSDKPCGNTISLQRAFEIIDAYNAREAGQ